MSRKLFLLSMLVMAGSMAFTRAETRQGPRSAIVTDTMDAGGGLSAGAQFNHLGSLGGIGGVSTSSRLAVRHGYVPQVDLRLRLPPIVVARAKATCRSVVMSSFSGLIQGEMNTNYVTTYDGGTTQPNTTVFSGESRPRAGQPGAYEADFLTYNSAGVLWQYGSFVTWLPTTDTDQNTLPDVFQLDCPGNATVTGQSIPDWPPTIPPGTIDGQMRREADALTGSYDTTLRNAFGSVSYSQTFSLVYFEFEIGYSRGTTNHVHFTQVRRASNLFTNLAGGVCVFTVTGQDQILLPQFALTNRDGTTYTVLPTTLIRTGRKYLGEMRLADGNLRTPWPDFTRWVLELTDDTDRDQDGVPDLSDTDEPPVDTDGDGMPDDFELAHRLDPLNPADATRDTDGDGSSNLMEYWAGTDPQDPKSALRIGIELRDGGCYLTFEGRTNRTYRFEQSRDLAARQWEILSSEVVGADRRFVIPDTNVVQDRRYYRLLATPNKP